MEMEKVRRDRKQPRLRKVTLAPSIDEIPEKRKQHSPKIEQQTTTTPIKLKKQNFILRDNIVLHEVVGTGDDKRLRDLMPLVKKRVFNINAPDEDWCSRSPLHVACSHGSLQCCQILLEHGAYPTSVTLSGVTPGHFAAEYGHLKILQLLFYYGADLKAEDISREKPLDVAEKYNHLECIEFLKRIENFHEKENNNDDADDAFSST